MPENARKHIIYQKTQVPLKDSRVFCIISIFNSNILLRLPLGINGFIDFYFSIG